MKLGGEFFLQADPLPCRCPTVSCSGWPRAWITHSILPCWSAVDNPSGKLLIGQFVTATLHVPLEDNLVEIPTMALNEER